MNDDSELFKKIRQGNEGAFTIVFDRYYSQLCYYADKFLYDLDESRSLVQQVFVDLWIKRNKLLIKQSLKAYLFKSVQNSSLDFLKHRLVESKYVNQVNHQFETEDCDLIVEAELNARLNAAIEGLPEKCRQIFTLCRFEELHYNEIAQRLGISIKTVEMQMGIAIKKLKLKLSDIQYIQILIYLFSKNIRAPLQGN